MVYRHPIRPDDLYIRPLRPNELYHHGVKGQKWGVRNGPPYPLKRAVANSTQNGTIKHTVIHGHQSVPRESEPNSVIDHADANGKIDSRTIYDSDGKIDKQINTTDHGNPKHHPYGEHGEHVHEYSWNDDGTVIKTTREVTPDERKENGDIL